MVVSVHNIITNIACWQLQARFFELVAQPPLMIQYSKEIYLQEDTFLEWQQILLGIR